MGHTRVCRFIALWIFSSLPVALLDLFEHKKKAKKRKGKKQKQQRALLNE
jgi:hypothetical protein